MCREIVNLNTKCALQLHRKTNVICHYSLGRRGGMFAPTSKVAPTLALICTTGQWNYSISNIVRTIIVDPYYSALPTLLFSSFKELKVCSSPAKCTLWGIELSCSTFVAVLPCVNLH